jgi:hypothetical protein
VVEGAVDTDVSSGAWLIFPAYMIYVFWEELVEGLTMASGESLDSKKSD